MEELAIIGIFGTILLVVTILVRRRVGGSRAEQIERTVQITDFHSACKAIARGELADARQLLESLGRQELEVDLAVFTEGLHAWLDATNGAFEQAHRRASDALARAEASPLESGPKAALIGNARGMLGAVLVRMGRLTEARDHLCAALSLPPETSIHRALYERSLAATQFRGALN